MFPLKNLACKGLRELDSVTQLWGNLINGKFIHTDLVTFNQSKLTGPNLIVLFHDYYTVIA